MQKLNSYPKVYAIGHRQIKGIFGGPVTIEEKVDGSQFSMGVNEDGKLMMRSKGQQILEDAPEKMFSLAVETAQRLKPLLRPKCTYRCEYLNKPKHNALAYNRVPDGNIILFDVMIAEEDYAPYGYKVMEAGRLGLEVVPLLFEGVVDGVEGITSLLQTESILGGQKIEGFVVKNRDLFTDDKKMACGKYVSDSFKEIHNKEWKASNPTGKDFVQLIIEQYRSEARWQKTVQHLRESDQLDDSPKDIGSLLKGVKADIKEECADEIKDKLFGHFWKQIERGVTAGLPEWYKEQLLLSEFEPVAPEDK